MDAVLWNQWDVTICHTINTGIITSHGNNYVSADEVVSHVIFQFLHIYFPTR